MNKTLRYLVPASLNSKTQNGLNLRSILADNDELLIQGFYSGYQKLDEENNIYMVCKVTSNKAFTDLASSPAVKEIIQIGNVTEDKIIVVFGMETKVNNIKELFIKGKYSKLYTHTEIKELLSRREMDKDTANVLMRSVETRKKIEDAIGAKLPYDAELDSKIDLNQEVYDNRV